MALTTLEASEGYVVQSSQHAALVLDSNGNAVGVDTAAASVTLVGYNATTGAFSSGPVPQFTTAAAPAYVKGAMYFDTTLNKLRIGGATAWESVTSA